MKKILSKMIFILILFFTSLMLVNASSEYYNYKWTNTWYTYDQSSCDGEQPPEEGIQNPSIDSWNINLHQNQNNNLKSAPQICFGDMYIVNDTIETDKGILAVGFVDMSISSVLLVSKNGTLINAYDYSEKFESQVFFKKIIKNDNTYYVIGNVIGPNGGIGILKINSDGSYISSSIIASGTNLDRREITIEEQGDYYYIIGDFYNNKSAYGIYDMIRTNKNFSNAKVLIQNEEIKVDLTENEKKLIKNYTVLSNNDIHYQFLEQYNKGLLYSYYNNDETWTGDKIEYILDGTVKWSKKYKDYWLKDAIFTENKVIILAMDESINNYDAVTENLKFDINNQFNFYIIVLDSNGKELAKEKLSNYTDGKTNFQAEHIRKVNGGFIITGVSKYSIGSEQAPEEGEQQDTPLPNLKYEGDMMYNAQMLYFQVNYAIKTKTDGNGTVKSSKSKADVGSEVTFVVTPKKGYQIDIIKVTDKNNNTIVFTSNKFTMPSADVTIEATFSIKNPDTGSFISMIAIAFLLILLIAGMIILKLYKRRLYRI